MTAQIESIRFQVATSLGNQDITTSKLGGLTPSAVIFLYSHATADATVTDNAVLGIGMGDGTRERAMASWSEHGQNRTDTKRYLEDTRCLVMVDAGGVRDGEADLVTFIANGVRINWPSGFVPSVAYYCTAIFFAGSSVSARVDTVTPGNSGVESNITTIGFEPQFVALTHVARTTGAGDTNHAELGLGFISNEVSLAQRAFFWGERDNQADGIPFSRVSSNRCGLAVSVVDGSLSWQLEAHTFDSQGFSITPRDGNCGQDVYYLAVDFADEIETNVGHLTTPTTGGSNSETGPGHRPQALLQIGTHCQAVDALEADNDAGVCMYAVADSGEQSAYSMAIEDAQATTDTASYIDNIFYALMDGSNVVDQEATWTSWDANGWTENWSNINGTGRIRIWASFEVANVVVAMNAATLASAPQDLNVTFQPVNIPLVAASLVSSPQPLDVVLAGAIVSLQPAYLGSVFLRASPVRIGVTSWHTPASVVNTVIPEVQWASPSGAKEMDERYPASILSTDSAVADLADGEFSDYLDATDFGFTVGELPSGATIVGIEVVYRRIADIAAATDEISVRLLSGGSPVGDDKQDETKFPSAAWEMKLKGGVADTWNASLTDANIRASTFGFRLQIDNSSGGSVVSLVDAIWIRVTYTAGVVSMNAATLASSPQALDVVPGGVNVPMSEAPLVSAPQAITVSSPPPAQSIPMTVPSLVSSPQGLNVTPGPVSVPMSEATLISAAQTLDVLPGGIVAFMNAATLVSAAQALAVLVGNTDVEMSAATLVSAAQSLGVIPGATAVELNAVTLTGSPQTITVITVAPQTVNMVAATLASAAQALDVLPGGVTLPMVAATLASSPQALSILVGQTIAMQAVTLTGSPQALSIVPGGVAVPMNAATLVSSAQTLRAFVSQVLAMNAATLASSPQALGVIPGGVFPQMNTATLVSSAQGLNILPGGVSVPMVAATLASSPQNITIIVLTPQTVVMSPATLVSAAQTLNVAVDNVLPMQAVSLASSPQGLTVLPGGVSPQMDAVSLASAAQGLVVIPGGATVPLSPATLVSSPQPLVLLVAPLVQMQAATLVASALSLIVLGEGFVGIVNTTIDFVTPGTRILRVTPTGHVKFITPKRTLEDE